MGTFQDIFGKKSKESPLDIGKRCELSGTEWEGRCNPECKFCRRTSSKIMKRADSIKKNMGTLKAIGRQMDWNQDYLWAIVDAILEHLDSIETAQVHSTGALRREGDLGVSPVILNN